MMTTLMTRFAPAVLLSALVGMPAIAQEEDDLDVFLGRPTVGTQTVFGGITEPEDPNPVTVPGQRVFEAGFDFFGPGNVFLGAEPGFQNPGLASPLNANFGALSTIDGDTIAVNRLDVTIDGVTDALFFWDGTGAVNFTPTTVNLDIDDSELPIVGPTGEFDDHPEFLLEATPGVAPADGVYLASFSAEIVGFDPTDQLFLVIGASSDPLVDLEDSIGAAVSFVENTLVVPEPSAAALLLTVVAGVAARRRV